MKQYDAIIIGFGKGGKTLAAELAKRKLDVAVVERSEKMYGLSLIHISVLAVIDDGISLRDVGGERAAGRLPVDACQLGVGNRCV